MGTRGHFSTLQAQYGAAEIGNKNVVTISALISIIL